MKSLESPSNRYSAVAQALHWATAILVVAAFIFGPGGSEERVYATARDAERQLHETLGLCVLVLTIIRLLWRSFDTQPDPPELARWMDLAAQAVRVALYLLLLVLPLTAIAGAWLEGHPLTLLAGLRIASPFPPSPPLHEAGTTIAILHTWLGDAILWVAGFHALAALYHHWVLRDGVLQAMLPRWLTIPRGEKRR